MNTGDSTMMMMLSLNLLILVFFMLLNSMATQNAKRNKENLTDVVQSASLPSNEDVISQSLTAGTPVPAWRESVLIRLQGVMVNRIDLRVLPQVGNATSVEVEIPLGAIFDANGRLLKPEIIRNMQAAAGTDSSLRWQVRGRDITPARRTSILATLAVAAGHAESFQTGKQALRVIVTPGLQTKPQTGLQIQQIGEDAGGVVQGVDMTGGADE